MDKLKIVRFFCPSFCRINICLFMVEIQPFSLIFSFFAHYDMIFSREEAKMENGNFQDLLNCRVQIDLQKIVFRQCSPEWHIRRGRIDNANLTYVISGEADYSFGDSWQHVRPGDLIFVPHGGLRQAFTNPENLMHCYSVDFGLRDSAGQPVPLPFPNVSHVKDANIVTDLFSKMNISWLQRDEQVLLRIRALLLLLISHLLLENHTVNNTAGAVDDRIRSVMTHIERHYADPLSLDYFASELHLNKVYLGSLFRKSTGLSFHQYLLNARLNAAEDLLYTGKHTVNEVAELTGFQDVSYFSRVFTKANGVRPGRYQKLEKPREPRHDP